MKKIWDSDTDILVPLEHTSGQAEKRATSGRDLRQEAHGDLGHDTQLTVASDTR